MLLLVLLLSGSTAGTRPKGVRVELASLYNPSIDFSCLDGSGSIPFIQVNDDYCDCDDGSDEPGTSACPSGKFFCENRGHRSRIIPSSRVNDGICDCCDGTDEWEAGSVCQDSCMELGRAAREAAHAAAKVAMEGFSIKQGMIKEGKRLLDEHSGNIIEKEKLKVDLAAKKEELRLAKEKAEAPEKEALDFYKQLEEEEKKKMEEAEKVSKNAEAEQYFNKLDTNHDGVISREELQSRTALDTNKDGTVTEEEAEFFLSGKEQYDMETFMSIGYILIKPYLDLEAVTTTTEETPDNTDEGMDGILDPPEQDFSSVPPPLTSSTESELDDDEVGEVDADPQVYDPWRANQMKEQEIENTEVDDYEDDDDEDEKDDGEEGDEDDYDVADPPGTPQQDSDSQIEDKYDEQTKSLIAAANEARKNYDDLDRQLRDIEGEISRINDVIAKDYGPEDEFLVLSGQCFEYTDNEYVYKMCPYESCSQRSKHGGSETRLGSWTEWGGSENNKYSMMKFSGGQQCWNGPARSTLVHFHCGVDNKLTSVSEPNRCEYEMHLTTPAVCAKPSSSHDEL